MKTMFVIAALVLAGCSSKNDAQTAYHAMSRPCDDDTFTFSVKDEGVVRTITVTCELPVK